MEQNNRGGKRLGSGRKPTTNPKKAVTLYVQREKILTFGSPEKLKDKLYGFINEQALKSEIAFTATNPSSYDSPKLPANYFSDEPKQYKEAILDPIGEYQRRIAATTYSGELEALMKQIKADKTIGWKGQNNLEFFAQEHAKQNFTY